MTLPLNHLASKVVVNAQENLMKARDQRTALMNEVLQGIRMLKYPDFPAALVRRSHLQVHGLGAVFRTAY